MSPTNSAKVWQRTHTPEAKRYAVHISFSALDTRGMDVWLEFEAEVLIPGSLIIFANDAIEHVAEALRLLIYDEEASVKLPWRLGYHRESRAECYAERLRIAASALTDRTCEVHDAKITRRGDA